MKVTALSIRFIYAPLILAATASNASAQKLAVTIIGREDSQTQYNYVVPGYSSSQTNGNANCSATPVGTVANVNYNEHSTTMGYSTPPHAVSFSVTGATFALQLPDGRVAVVNCVSKFAEHFAGHAGNHRSCRMPFVNDIQAEFKGKDAKLQWVVSIDGKKMDSETYRIIAVLDKPQP